MISDLGMSLENNETNLETFVQLSQDYLKTASRQEITAAGRRRTMWNTVGPKQHVSRILEFLFILCLI